MYIQKPFFKIDNNYNDFLDAEQKYVLSFSHCTKIF